MPGRQRRFDKAAELFDWPMTAIRSRSAACDAAKTSRNLGVEFMTAQGTARPLNDVMLSLADAFQRLPEGGARTAAAMSLLGRSGTIRWTK